MSAAARRSASWLTTGTESSPVQQITSIDAERLAAKSAANATAEAARSEPSVRAQRKNQSLAVRETADREPSQLGLKRPPSTSAAPLARFLRPLQMSAVSERFACPSWSAAERADGPLHPSRWRQSYGKWAGYPSKPGLADGGDQRRATHLGHRGSAARWRPTTAHLIKHTACRDAMSECRSRKRRRLSPALPSPQVRRFGAGLSGATVGVPEKRFIPRKDDGLWVRMCCDGRRGLIAD
jgi:hypothetical protein